MQNCYLILILGYNFDIMHLLIGFSGYLRNQEMMPQLVNVRLMMFFDLCHQVMLLNHQNFDTVILLVIQNMKIKTFINKKSSI